MVGGKHKWAAKKALFPHASAKAQHACNSSLFIATTKYKSYRQRKWNHEFQWLYKCANCTNMYDLLGCSFLGVQAVQRYPMYNLSQNSYYKSKNHQKSKPSAFQNLQIYSLPKTGLSLDFLHQIACSRLGLAFHQTAPWAQGDDHVLCHGTCLTNNHETTMAGDGRSFENHMGSHG